jgi:hypothetical protein
MRGPAAERVRDLAQTALGTTIEQALTSDSAARRPPTIPVAVVAQYIAGAFLNLFTWWLEAQMPYPPDQMDRFFKQLALPGVRATIEGT